MRREIFQTIEIPSGIEVNFDKNDSKFDIKGPHGEVSKKVNSSGLEIGKEGNVLRIGCKSATKKEKKMINTIKAHVENLIEGVQNKFEYRLKICFSHFPITAEVKGNEMIIKNFLGEKANRKTKIPEGAEVKVEREIITVTSTNKEIAGQAAANIERATKVSKRDRRVFQDGIFMINKAGREI